MVRRVDRPSGKPARSGHCWRPNTRLSAVNTGRSFISCTRYCFINLLTAPCVGHCRAYGFQLFCFTDF
jgi:hypothetical protein